MTARQPDILVPRESEARMVWAIMLSGVVHAAAIVAFVIAPRFWPERSSPSVSYTVDLVASAEPAGTNLPSGGRRKGPAAPPAPPIAPAPPAARVEPPKAPEKPVQVNPVESANDVKPHDEVPPPVPVQPKSVEAAPPPEKPVEKPAPVVPPKPIEAKPKVEPAQKAEVKLGEKKEPVASAKQAPTAAIAKATVAVSAKQASTAVVAKATVAPAPSKKPIAVAAQPPPTPLVTEAQAREQQIAAAIQRRVQDQRIADAVQRRAEAASQQGSGPVGAEGTSRAGPISVGQGTGSGGVVEGVEMILYRGQMERRIKENWVWAGDNPSLEVKVQFDVTESGQIQNVRVTGPSGNASYDASATRAVRAASPLAPPPEKYRELFVHGVEITFRAQDLQS